MSQIQIDIDARKIDDLVHFKVQRGDDSISSVLDYDEFNTPLKAITWSINQALKTIETPEIQRRITATIHQEIDPETGQSFWVPDSIDDVQLIPRDQGKSDFEALPGWATWTAQEAVDWIETNVTDLPSAKIVLQQMARAIVALRNRTID